MPPASRPNRPVYPFSGIGMVFAGEILNRDLPGGKAVTMRALPYVLLAILMPLAILQAQTVPDDEMAGRERLARQIETEVIAPCCWSQQVSEHQSPAARDMRADIRQRLAMGQTHDQVLKAYVAEYGDRILAVPPAKGFNYLLFVLPPFLFLATAVYVGLVLIRASRRGQAAQSADLALASAGANRYGRQLDDELADLD